jgi:SAM-dependent methyltransferase
MTVKSNVEWKFWGRQDPLWAVAAWKGRKKDGENPWTDEEFYELGRSDWSDFVRHWESYGLRKGSVVEIGCGAGRLTKAMAEYFDSVFALDVSQDMIEYARKRVGTKNVEFQLVDGAQIPCGVASVDAVFSAQVFQHLEDKKDVEAYFRERGRVLSPGGSLMIHIPMFAWPPQAGDWVKRFYAIGRRIDDLKAGRLRKALDRGGSNGLMRMRSYPIRFFYDFLPPLGFVDIEIAMFVSHSNDDVHPFVFATKS